MDHREGHKRRRRLPARFTPTSSAASFALRLSTIKDLIELGSLAAARERVWFAPRARST